MDIVQSKKTKKADAEKFYVATAIPYVNAHPHIGHALEFIQADVIARYQASIGKTVEFATGADENSLKNVQAAENKGITTAKLCEENAAIFKKMADQLGLTYTIFLRTSIKKDHWPGVQNLWELCDKSGDIYKKKYKGLYCVGCEAFYEPNELPNGLCPEHNKAPESVEEENYFFRLSKYQQTLEDLILKDDLRILPESRKNEVLAFIRGGLQDFSISRSVHRAKGWGVPVSGDKTQIMYVWFDALGYYLTGVGYGTDEKKFKAVWPVDTHVIGKGIIRFHAIYWPAMLLSAGLATPKSIFVHGYITVEGQKMSKSLGNVVDPMKLLSEYGADQLRYYLLAEIPVFSDGDFSTKSLINRINNELVANVGNLVNRTLVFITNNFDGKIHTKGKGNTNDELFLNEQKKVIDSITQLLEKYELTDALHQIMLFSKNSNKYFQDNKPWELVKSDKERAGFVLSVLVNQIADLAILLEPYIPETTAKIVKMLKLKEEKWEALGISHFKDGHAIGKPHILFEKIEPKKIDAKEVKQDSREFRFYVTPKAESLGITATAAIITVEKISNKSAELDRLKEQKFTIDDQGYRDLHKKVGAEETTSIHSLYTLVEKNGKIPNINTVVDSYNFISLKTGIAAGAHDIRHIKGDIRIDLCTGTEKFTPLGTNDPQSIKKGEYAALDTQKVICRLELKQCEQTKVTKDTHSILLYYQGSHKHTQKQVTDALVEACELIKKVCGGSYKVIYPSNQDTISFADLDIEVGEIISAERHPNAEKLLVEKVRVKNGEIQLVSGIAKYYLPEEIVGKKILVLRNIPSAKLRGVESQGMLLVCESKEGDVEVIHSDAEVGMKVHKEGSLPSAHVLPSITIDDFFKVKMEIKSHVAYSEGKTLLVGTKELHTKKLKEGKIT